IKLITNIILSFALFYGSLSQAQELEPRSYINIPIAQNFLAVLYTYSDGDIFTAPQVPVQDVTLRVDGPFLGYAHTFALFGHSAKLDMSIGHACALGKAVFEGNNISRGFCGVTDSKIRLNYNFYGAPALAIQDFVKHKKQTVIGTSLQVNIPTGEYDTQYLLNIGSNRWYIKPEIGMSIPVGKWEFDFALGVKFFADNDEFKGVSTLRQDPIYNVQLHIVYDIVRGQWVAFDTNYFEGGDTYLDGVKSSLTRGNYRGGMTYSFAINSQNSIKLLANTGVTTRLGNKSNAYGLAWSYRWQ
ncbi:MAG: transporter, partial [Gammaproteobacteria bacterium]